ncbi:hypothetical protein PIB30_030012 [Stylosanthes scabra]|uniref:Uncharacterized protein n=1 Tax=Stylosanthes scabra TaxID=79078 RepID=A0ABU6RBP7_9FABA|nr:hypothetical protein [Stylosanthes scabra]
MVQKVTRGRQPKKMGEGTSSGVNGNEGRKEKVHAGTRFAVLNIEDPNVSVPQQSASANVPSNATKQVDPAHTTAPTNEPPKENTQPPNLTHQQITNPAPTTEHQRNPTTSNPTQNHIQITITQNEQLNSPMDLTSVPETARMEEDEINNPEPKPLDNLHSIDTEIMVEAAL